MRIAIIGAGVAGLKAAWRLEQEKLGATITIIEAGDRVGGRAYSKQVILSNGINTNINLGTQMNFEEFTNVAPELEPMFDDLFNIPDGQVRLHPTSLDTT